MRLTISFVLILAAGCSKTAQDRAVMSPTPPNNSHAHIVAMVAPEFPTRMVDDEKRTIDEIDVIGINLSDEDITSIRKTIDAIRQENKGEIVQIRQLSEYTVEVTTLTDRRPLSGGGSIIRLEFDGVMWRVKDITRFVS